MSLIKKLNTYLLNAAPHVRAREHCKLIEEAAIALNEPNLELLRAREALALAHAILVKLPTAAVESAAKRAAIKHEGNDPMGYIASVLATAKDETRDQKE